MTVKLGIADGTSVEVLEGLKEGDVVVSSSVTSPTTATTITRNPLGGLPGPPRR